ncbi:MAG: 23S rRNA (adenine(2503)-C(2))-methyltransferase RlmN [Bacteroidaceae bacterium]|nr:23S rRNA (adenine(2503)-C(2))-methyltransferase RlmN [Bacteroidaceae bacterium]
MRLLGKNIQELQAVVAELGMPRYAAKQMAQWMYQKHVASVDDMTNLSKAARKALKAHGYEVGAVEPLQKMLSADGTEKYLFPTEDGQAVETVFIPDEERHTLCVSTQVGCKMNCLFCQTGKQGFHGNLGVSDILAQVLWAERERGLTNIVVMGQGEPFDNFDPLLRALDIITSSDGFGWSPRRITVSTVGLRKNLHRFLQESQCHLAISLHSPIHEQRLQLMPAERQFPIEEIVEMLRTYEGFRHQRRLSFEYIVLHGMNDTPAHAKALVRLLRGLECRVNLIRWHAIPNVNLPPTDEASMLQLRDYLTQHGIYTTIRATRGEDIMAACGMLTTTIQ